MVYTNAMLLPLLNFGPKGRPWPADHGVRAPNWLRVQPFWRWLEQGGGRYAFSLGLLALAVLVMALSILLAHQRKAPSELRRTFLAVLILQWLYMLGATLVDFEMTWHANNVAASTIIVGIFALYAKPAESTFKANQ